MKEINIIEISAKVYTIGVKKTEAWGHIGSKNLTIANNPNFNIIPANKTDPSVEASTCASGNQIWTGTMGTLVAKGINNKNHISFSIYILKGNLIK